MSSEDATVHGETTAVRQQVIVNGECGVVQSLVDDQQTSTFKSSTTINPSLVSGLECTDNGSARVFQ